MSFAAFDVVVVPFPYSDRLAEKRRPALVVSAPPLAGQLGRVWVAMITTNRGQRLFGDAAITNLKAAGLPADSLIRASKIATIEIDHVVRRAGQLSEQDVAAAMIALRDCAGF